MKSTILGLLATVLLSLGAATPASAATAIDLGSSNDGVTLDAAYTYNDYMTTVDSVLKYFTLGGTLSGNSKMVLSFSLTDPVPTSDIPVVSYGSVSTRVYSLGTTNLIGSLTGDTFSGASTYTYDPAKLLVIGALGEDLLSGSITITNLIASKVDIASITFGFFSKLGGTLRVSLDVTSVPLPAALPLFGLGIASLAGYAAKRRKVRG